MKKLILNILLFISIYILYIFTITQIFKPVIFAESLIFPYALTPFDIINLYPKTWKLILILFYVSTTFTFCISYYNTFKNLLKNNHFFINNKNLHHKPLNSNELNLKIGTSYDNTDIYIPEKGLFQNI